VEGHAASTRDGTDRKDCDAVRPKAAAQLRPDLCASRPARQFPVIACRRAMCQEGLTSNAARICVLLRELQETASRAKRARRKKIEKLTPSFLAGTRARAHDWLDEHGERPEPPPPGPHRGYARAQATSSRRFHARHQREAGAPGGDCGVASAAEREKHPLGGGLRCPATP